LVTNFSQLGPTERTELLWGYVEKRLPLLLLGPAGSGKSYIGLKLMQRFIDIYFNGARIVWLREIDEMSSLGENEEIKALYVSGSANVTKLDLLGGRVLLGGQYVRKPGFLQKMIEKGGIVFLDEVTSLPPQFTILLNEIIDSIYRGEANENFYIFFAGNPSNYLGANELPDALLERLVSIWFDYYPIQNEIEIVIDMVKKNFGEDPMFNEKGFYFLVQYIVSILREIREELNNVGEICPISVRSMMLAVTSVIMLSKTTQRMDPSGFSRTAVYKALQGLLPDNLVEVWNSDIINELYSFMERYKIGWNHVKDAVKNLGILSKYVNTKEIQEIISRIPE